MKTRIPLPAYLPVVGQTYDVCGSRGNGQIRIENIVQDGKGWLIDARIVSGEFTGTRTANGILRRARKMGKVIVTRVEQLHWLPRLAKQEECGR